MEGMGGGTEWDTQCATDMSSVISEKKKVGADADAANLLWLPDNFYPVC